MEITGTFIGQFTIIKPIGKGGMGEVFEAMDTNLQRKVAIKTIRKGKLDELARARFLREARILSNLDHPNICRVHEYIEGDTRDYLVLEYIKGKTLRRALRRGLPDNFKFEIARQITSALAAAHERNIVHRDLKPENIMLTPKGLVKVLDFGLSHQLEESGNGDHPSTKIRDELEVPYPDLMKDTNEMERLEIGIDLPEDENDTESTPTSYPPQFKTETGYMIGTPGYISPEQSRGEALSTSSDMFVLGLIFHELFTGERVFPSKGDIMDILLKLREGKIPPAEGIDEDLAELIEQLKSTNPKLRPSAPEIIRRLEWIGEKPKRKLKQRLTYAAFIVTLIVAFSLGFLSLRLNREVKRANREAQTAQQVTRFLTDLFAASAPVEARGRVITAREILEQGVNRIHLELQGQPGTQARLLNTIGDVYRSVGDYKKALPLLLEALETGKKNLPTASEELATFHYSLGNLYKSLHRWKDALPHYKIYLDYMEKTHGAGHIKVARPLTHLGKVYRKLGEKEPADKLYKRAAAICNGIPDQQGGIDLVYALYELSFEEHSDYQKAIDKILRALTIFKRIYPHNHPDRAVFLNLLATNYTDLGDFSKAKTIYKEALALNELVFGPHHVQVAIVLVNIATLHVQQGKYTEAEPLFKRALKISEKLLGTSHRFTGQILGNLGTCYYSQARYEEAEKVMVRGSTIMEKIKPPSPNFIYILNNLANVYSETGRLKQAEAVHLRSWAITDKLLPPLHLNRAISRNNLAEVYERMNRLKESEKLYAQAKDILEKVLGPNHYAVGENMRGTAAVFLKQSRLDKALDYTVRADKILQKALGQKHILVGTNYLMMARVYVKKKETSKALEYYKKAIAILEKVWGPDNKDLIPIYAEYNVLKETSRQ